MTVPETVSRNPATGEIIGRTPVQGADDVVRAVASARQAQKGWAALDFRERRNHVTRVRDFITAHADSIAKTISRENGKTRMDALTTEVIPAAMAADYYGRTARHALRRRRLFPGSILFVNKRSYIDRVPFGVVGIISPWNYPFSIPFHEIIMGLMAGNGVILKMATQAQEVGKALEECMAAGGFPEGLFAQLHLPGERAGDAFINAGIDKLFFTGSVEVGKTLMGKAAARLLPVSLELGGNDPMIVCNDANLLRAAGGALWAGFSNAGQSCGGVERIYVEKGVYEDFVRLLRARVEQLTYGDGSDPSVQVGAMTTAKQVRTVTEHVDDALEKGGVITATAQRFVGSAKGQFFPPMVIERVNETMVTMQRETFGPVVAVQCVADLDEAVTRANDSFLGLTASVWTRNRRTAHRIAARLEAGTVTVNDHLMSHGLAETPWGGFKQSGIGRTHGCLGLEEMTQPRVVVDDILPAVQKNMWWYPHSEKVYHGLLGVLPLLYGRGIAQRLRGGARVLGTFARTFQKD